MNLYPILHHQIITQTGPEPNGITHISYDSRTIGNQGCFICIRGEQSDGHRFIDMAVNQGAVQVIGDDEEALHEHALRHPHVQFILVQEPKKAMALYAAHLEEDPHHELSLIGVTGTQGKTTITAYVRSLLNRSGIKTGSIGTAGVWDHEKPLPLPKSTPTTPESADLFDYLSRMRQKQITSVVMEATSIGLDQDRLHGLHFDVAVHSNLSPEHLDYHETFEAYKQAKLRLFDHAETAVVNVDDDGMSQDILDAFTGPVWTYGMNREADVKAENLRYTKQGSHLDLIVDGVSHDVFLPVFGLHNVYNAIAAITVCLAKGLGLRHLLTRLSSLEGPPGRLQLIPEVSDRLMLFDFAHTPQTLTNLFHTIKPLRYKRLIVMVTGIGIREKSLRAPIAEAVEGRADEIVVTADHPGNETAEAVVADVMAGFRSTKNVHPVAYRGEAIQKAMSLSSEGDLVLITGICMEDFRIINGEKQPYYDYDYVRDFLCKHPCLKSKVASAN
ncbi:UDP-N-acetylmuramoyl-L-alanyl-D-glutamate--2,6-diaminopimelate ligase [Bacillus daqingensis]|uniref:UDP-N-acetylmuramyl-tripeptide synthetase n=1 Tax=Bacillus daqingensis TaxID=872396 RepID=A0ABV9NTK8_9BACI